MADQQPSGKWVLVTGTGVIEADSLPAEVAWATAELSRALAREGHSLVTGDWPGVDVLAAQTYAAELRSLGIHVTPLLKQVVSKDEPYERLVEGADVKREDTMFDTNLSKLGLADFVVLVGGVGGTLKMFRGAQLMRKPVLPIAGTGGDAEEAFKDVLSGWNERPVEGITKEEFNKLGRPITAEEDARAVVADLVSLIDKIIGPRNKPREIACLVLTPDEERFAGVRRAIIEALRGAGVRPLTTGSDGGRPESGPAAGVKLIEKSDLIIADITGGRPNVMYELGFAHAVGKPVFRILERAEGGASTELSRDADYVYDPAATELVAEMLKWVERNKNASK